jgi:uncharacterized protein involved in type VI secretion and phage assembly
VNGGGGRTYFGKYRGRVFNNEDPKLCGRIQVQVPDITGLNVSNWAMPCLPFTGLQSGLYLVPPVGAGVWVEFEQGDIDHPIWTGCWWGGREEVPVLAQAPVVPPQQNIVLQTAGGHAVAINDQKGSPVSGILLRAPGGAMIQINDTGIVITNGTAKITLRGNAVSINGTNLVVT